MSLTDEQITVLLKGIVPSRVSTMEGMSYVESWDIRAMMNRVFGFCGWSLTELAPARLIYEQETSTRAGKPAYKVAYQASVALTIGDVSYSGSAVGESIMPDFKRGDCHDMALKTAESGALKRAAINLGDQFGLSLYKNGTTDPVVRKIVGWTPQKEDAAS